MSAPNLVIVTKGPAVLSTHETGLQGLDKCSHEEADSHIFVHAKYAAEHGSKAVMVKANDTYVVVIAVLSNSSEFWARAVMGGIWSRSKPALDQCAWPVSLYGAGEG